MYRVGSRCQVDVAGLSGLARRRDLRECRADKRETAGCERGGAPCGHEAAAQEGTAFGHHGGVEVGTMLVELRAAGVTALAHAT